MSTIDKIIQLYGHKKVFDLVEETDPEPEQFLDKYQCLAHLGSGASSRVYLVEDEIGKTYAAKVPKEERFRDCITNEICKMGYLGPIKSGHNPRLIDVVENNGDPVIIMDYIDGSQLKSFLGAPFFNEVAVRDFASQLGSHILEVNGWGISHGDINPNNILLSHHSNHWWLIDYSSSCFNQMEEIPRGHCRGTKQFRSPEQDQDTPISLPSDLYSFGLVLNCMAHGTLEHYREPTKFSDTFNRGLHYLLHEDPNKRSQGLAYVLPMKHSTYHGSQRA